MAVLPFADMSPGKDQEYFADLIAEEILNALVRVEGLKVIGRTSSFSFKGKNEDLCSIGQKLGAGTLLEGSVRRGGDRIRVTAQLVRASDGSHLWSETFDRNLPAVFAIQEEVARDVARALRGKLLPTPAQTRTANLEAYNQYLLGNAFLWRATVEDTKRALAAYEKAIALDPAFAPAWAGASIALLNTELLTGATDMTRRERARFTADRARALAPDIPEGHVASGWVRWFFEWDVRGALADMDRARALAPNLWRVEMARGRMLSALGRQEEALAAATRSTELEPLNAWPWYSLAEVLGNRGDLNRERQALDRALEIAPGHGPARGLLVDNLILSGKPTEALALAREWWGAGKAPALEAVTLWDLGDHAGSRALLDALVARGNENDSYEIAAVFAWQGDRDRAFEWLEQAARIRHPGIVHLNFDPAMRRLREDPRLKPFLRKVNVPDVPGN